MAKPKKPYNLARKIVVQLRNIHRSWPNKNQCLRNAKVDKNAYRCTCVRAFRKEYMRIDHISPIGPEPKLVDGKWVPAWDEYIDRVFSPLDNYQAICLDCHDLKTAAEKAERKKLSENHSTKKEKGSRRSPKKDTGT